MGKQLTPTWVWDHEAEAGYIDFEPQYEGNRVTRSLYVSGAVSVLADFDGDGGLLGIEVLV